MKNYYLQYSKAKPISQFWFVVPAKMKTVCGNNGCKCSLNIYFYALHKSKNNIKGKWQIRSTNIENRYNYYCLKCIKSATITKNFPLIKITAKNQAEAFKEAKLLEVAFRI